MPTLAEVRLWGRTIGAASLEESAGVTSFQYAPEFVGSGIEVAPLAMPLAARSYSFPALPRISFHGLPGLLADSLPDRFGNALIDAWLAGQGRTPASFNAVERLCYTGARGMGALEFVPVIAPRLQRSEKVNVSALVALASEILANRNGLSVSFVPQRRREGLEEILRVGTSAGGARAKAIIAWNPDSNEVRSGQVSAPEGFGHWLLKFDGVRGNQDKELEDPQGYTVIEYAYSLMARDAGLEMTECRLLEESGRRHFMTRRFDRTADGGKLHMQSLAALGHLDFNAAGAHSYEQAFDAIKRLGLPMSAREQQFRRMLFNVVARDQDDHVKNIAFLMDKTGRWSLAPAFDVTFSFNPQGAWTAHHQMTINGKRERFELEDFSACARVAGLKRGRAETMLDEVSTVVAGWKGYAEQAGVSPQWRAHIQATLQLRFGSRAARRARKTTGPSRRRATPGPKRSG
ncbi:MAG: type II toxin-antitoxin system HipA family toxin [Steroidobacteraceae bacterium]